MLSRLATQYARHPISVLRHSRRIFPLHPSRRLTDLSKRPLTRPRYGRFWPLTITCAVISAGIPIGYILYRDLTDPKEENFDDNTESVSQSELDTLLAQTQHLLNSELYLNRSSVFFVPIRLFFRTLKLILIFTPVLIFYFYQEKFAPHLFDKWCFTLKRSVLFIFIKKRFQSLPSEPLNTAVLVLSNSGNGWRHGLIYFLLDSVRYSTNFIRMHQHIPNGQHENYYTKIIFTSNRHRNFLGNHWLVGLLPRFIDAKSETKI